MNDWRDRRNGLLHCLLGKNAVSSEATELCSLAVEGMELVKRLDGISGAMARLMRKYERRLARRR